MPMHLGVDDTDSLRGMCTTYLATELVRALSGWDLIGYPRLVRLNPNIPWKTRGNGAICLRLGRGRGRGMTVGEIDGAGVVAYERAGPPPPSEEIAEIAVAVVERWADVQDPTTNPALVLLRTPPPPGLYCRAGRPIVPTGRAPPPRRGPGAPPERENGPGGRRAA